MKNNTIEKIEKEIDEKTKLPNEIKDKMKKDIFTNISVAVVIITYFIFIILGSIGTIKNVRKIDINIFSLLFLGVTIFLFENAYRKENGSLAMYGIETLAVAVFTLFLPYIIYELDEVHKKYYLMASIYIGAYYILKAIFVSARTKAKYLNSISDVKELVKKEKLKVTNKDNLKESENKENENKEKDNIESKEKKAEPAKKRGRPKKEKTESPKKNNNQKETEKSKKRGRPKKEIVVEGKNTVSKKANEVKEPKKRGRPRKVVTQ